MIAEAHAGGEFAGVAVRPQIGFPHESRGRGQIFNDMESDSKRDQTDLFQGL
jgi:hypothetical protein